MVDYEEIQRGRRRNWWKALKRKKTEKQQLTPREEMARLLREAKNPLAVSPEPASASRPSAPASEPGLAMDLGLPGPPPDPALLAAARSETDTPPVKKKRLPAREQSLHEQHEKDRKEWQRTKRQLMWFGAIAGGALVIFLGIQQVGRLFAGGHEKREMREFMHRAEKKESFYDLSTPIRAMATYRNNWMRGDMRPLWEMTVTQVQKDILAVRGVEKHIAEQRRLYLGGAFHDWLEVLRGLDNLEYLQRPSLPYRDGELAVFRSKPMPPPRGQRDPIRYVFVFAYQKGKWKYVQSGPESTWKTTWTSLYQIKPGIELERPSL